MADRPSAGGWLLPIHPSVLPRQSEAARGNAEILLNYQQSAGTLLTNAFDHRCTLAHPRNTHDRPLKRHGAALTRSGIHSAAASDAPEGSKPSSGRRTRRILHDEIRHAISGLGFRQPLFKQLWLLAVLNNGSVTNDHTKKASRAFFQGIFVELYV